MERIITQKYLDFCRSRQDISLVEKFLRGGYIGTNFQCHHIYPKCFYPSLQKSKYNLVMLTTEEHIEAHRILAESKNNVMVRVYNLMSKRNLSLNGTWHSEKTKEKMRKPKSDETKKNISLSLRGKKRKPCLNRWWQINHKVSEETKEKMRLAHLGKPSGNSGKRRLKDTN